MAERLYLVTGAAGHVGNVLIGKLIRRGDKVRGLVLPGDRSVSYNGKIELVQGDVCNRESLEPFFENQDGREIVVIHTAGIVSISSKFNQKVYDVNVIGTKNIVDLCIKHRVKKLVHVSSVHAIPVPEDKGTIREVNEFDPLQVQGLYARTKAEATRYVLEKVHAGLLDACVVHPSGILGPGDHGHSHLTQLVIDYLNGSLHACVDGGYDFVDVRDVAKGILSCVETGRPGECYILSGGYYTVPELLDILSRISGRKPVKTVLPFWFAKATAPFSEIYYKMRRQPPLYTLYSMETLQTDADFSHWKATAELGYHPRPIEDTLQDMVRWIIPAENKTKRRILFQKIKKTQTI